MAAALVAATEAALVGDTLAEAALVEDILVEAALVGGTLVGRTFAALVTPATPQCSMAIAARIVAKVDLIAARIVAKVDLIAARIVAKIDLIVAKIVARIDLRSETGTDFSIIGSSDIALPFSAWATLTGTTMAAT